MNEKKLYVVGIGFSTGGLDAFQELFDHLPDKLGAAFVVVLDFSANSLGSLSNILTKHTPYQIIEATHDTLLQPNCIYLGPTGKTITIQKNRLQIAERPPQQIPPRTIDVFFHSLGNELKERAIGILLSGVGNDGSSGIQTIHGQGGMVMVQPPEALRMDSLPDIKLAVENSDWTTMPSHMGGRLTEYLHKGSKRKKQDESYDRYEEGPLAKEARLNEARLTEKNKQLLEANLQLQRRLEELEISEQKWKSLVHKAPDLIIRFDKNLRHTFVNEVIEKEFGIKRSDVLGKTNLEAVFPAKREAKLLMLDLRRVLKTGRILSHYTFVERQGQVCYLYIRLLPELSADGQIVESVLAIARDVTTLKNYEIELNHKNQELQRINEYLDNFVYAAAHDLQSPVVSLKILTRFINDPEHLDNQPTYVDRLSSEVDRLERTLGGLVELVRVQTMEDHIYDLSFADILSQVWGEFEHALPGIDVSLETYFESIPTVKYLKAYLLIIFRNLLSNALKYRLDARPLQLNISTEKSGRFVLLKFQDNGQGIDLPKNGQHLFKPFKQLSAKTEGIGLGLHLVKYTVERNGGRIEIESELNKGTCFLVYLNEYK